jgi:hypothetical protein
MISKMTNTSKSQRIPVKKSIAELEDMLCLWIYEIHWFIYRNCIYIYVLFIDQSSLSNKHVPDKIHLLGSASSLYIFMLALKMNVGPLPEV